MNRLTDDDELRRDILDLDAHRERTRGEMPPEPLIGLCCPHCRGDLRDPRGRFMGEAGRYVDHYLRSGLPTTALAFALVAWGTSYLVDTAYVVYRWALEVYARWGEPARTLTERLL